MNRWSAAAALLLAFVAALALRLPKLDARPLHNDEAVNAIKVTKLWEKGVYRYDPDEYHGPTLHYATLPFLWLSGAKSSIHLRDSALRLAPVFFGAALIFLLPLFKSGFDRRALVWAALFIVISPAMVFYSRYFIHEMLLVFFSVLTIGAGWRYAQSGDWRWATLTGVGVGLMFATKETFVITIAAMVGALVLMFVLGRARLPESTVFSKHAAIGFVAFTVVWVILFTSFFTNWQGLADSIRTYLPWLKRAGGHSPHIHPWYFYFERLAWFHPVKSPVWSELLVFALAIFGGIVGIRRKAAFPTFLAIFTLLLTFAYSAISYKTPWCLLNFYIGMLLLAGYGAASIRHWAITTCVVVSALQLAYQSYRASYVFASDRRNPYVYAQTVPDLLNLVEKVHSIAKVDTQIHDERRFETVIKVIAPDGDYWPLPWYLRRFKNVGWYDAMPPDPFAPIIIVGATMDARLDEKSEKKWIMAGYTELRPQKFLELYVEVELWKKYVATLPRDKE
ncbi:MAG TPA: flippase activity-associated protein Agl23 [Verrucomicrobiae bacterium]|nr:flippase activity-associated protein Agl23 [Verrucomicrobiae bacterium]